MCEWQQFQLHTPDGGKNADNSDFQNLLSTGVPVSSFADGSKH